LELSIGKGRRMRERVAADGTGTIDFPVRVILAALAALLAMSLLPITALAQRKAGDASFARGEVVVIGQTSGAPASMGLKARRHFPRTRMTTVAATPGGERALVASLRARGIRAELNWIFRAFGAPTDPFYSYQWHFGNIQGEEAWDLSDGSGAVVAVLDTGLRSGGGDGVGCVLAGYDFASRPRDGEPSDGNGHGTHVSGTIAQATNNGVGAAGMAPGACIMPVKVLGDDGMGFFTDVADGIQYAIDNGADVINMSLGTFASDNVRNIDGMDQVLDDAHSKNITVVCASGNDGSDANVSYPAVYPTTIAVGATDHNNSITGYSNGGNGIDLVAPGGNTNQALNGEKAGGGVLQETFIGGWDYFFFQGTSMASPHVAAVAALLISRDPSATPDNIYDALTTTSLDLGPAGFDGTFGHGLVQGYDAVYCHVTDTDGDTIGNCTDNCPDDANAGQEDADGDGVGDVCDACPADSLNDVDGDGFCAGDDNCPAIFNPGQEDIDLNGRGDACDVPAGGSVELPQTGMTQCSNHKGISIPCAGTGQDGDVGAGVPWPDPRFTDQDTGFPLSGQVAVDQLTGLMWLRDANCIQTTHPEADVDKKAGDGLVRWNTALDFAAGVNSGVYGGCGAGYADWRVPNINELASLLNAGTGSQGGWLLSQGFLNVKNAYWTSTTVAAKTGAAFSYQVSKKKREKNIFTGLKKGNLSYIMLVRGDTTAPAAVLETGQQLSYYPDDDGFAGAGVAADTPRFLDNGDATYLDTLTGLVWPSEASGVSSAACGNGEKQKWQDALEFVLCLNAFSYLGHTDWRLPNVNELLSLMNYGEPSIGSWLVSSGFTGVSAKKAYWTSTTSSASRKNAWRVSGKSGTRSAANKRKKNLVWPVRGVSAGP